MKRLAASGAIKLDDQQNILDEWSYSLVIAVCWICAVKLLSLFHFLLLSVHHTMLKTW